LARTVDVLPLADCVAADLLCELGVAEWSMGAAARAAATVERAVDAALSQRDLRAELRARIELAHLRLFVDAKDSTDELLELAAEAVPIFERYDDARSLGRTWLHVGFARGGVQRRNEEWRRAAEQALEHYRRTAWSPATCIGDLAAALMVGPVPARAARERCRELLAESHADRLSCAHVLVALAGLEAMLRRFARARRLIAEASATYEEIGFTRAVTSRANRNLGRIELLAQRPAAAAAVFRACCESFERDEDNGSLATTAAELAEALYRQGAHDEAEAWALVSAGRAAEDDLGAQYRWRGVMAKVLVGAGRLEEAEGLAREAVEITSRTDATNERGDALLSLAFVLRDSGDLRGASRTAEDGLVLFEEKENEAAAAQARSFLQAVALPSRR
jgi:tetratricopeptide (TPR) repeat protein